MRATPSSGATMSFSTLAFLGPTELIIILVLVVLIFGVGKLPDVAKQLGTSIKVFKKEMEDLSDGKSLDDGSVSDQQSEPRDVTRDGTAS